LSQRRSGHDERKIRDFTAKVDIFVLPHPHAPQKPIRKSPVGSKRRQLAQVARRARRCARLAAGWSALDAIAKVKDLILFKKLMDGA